MWPFSRKPTGDAAVIAELRAALDDADDGYSYAVQGRLAAEGALKAIQKAASDEGVADMARDVTAEIADIYASNQGGVRARDIAVHAVVAGAIRKAARGEEHWNEGGLARAAYREAG